MWVLSNRSVHTSDDDRRLLNITPGSHGASWLTGEAQRSGVPLKAAGGESGWEKPRDATGRHYTPTFLPGLCGDLLEHQPLPGREGPRKVGGLDAPYPPPPGKVGQFSNFVTLGGSGLLQTFLWGPI